MDGEQNCRRSVRLVAPTLCIFVIALLLWALFELQRMPYRPPHDMSTFLGGSEIAAVRLLMGVIAVVGGIPAIVWFAWRLRRD